MNFSDDDDEKKKVAGKFHFSFALPLRRRKSLMPSSDYFGNNTELSQQTVRLPVVREDES